MLSANTCSKISAVALGLSHTVVNHCLLFRCKASSIIIHHRFWNVSISVRKIDSKSSPSSKVSSLTKVCDMPRHVRLGLPVNSSNGQLVTRSTRHTCVSSHSELVTSKHRTMQSIIITRASPPVATCRQSPYLHKPAIIIMTSFSL